MTNGDKNSTATELILIDGRIAIVDAVDFPLVSPYRWRADKYGYVSHTVGPRDNRRKIYLHRFLVGAPDDFDVDHKDGDVFNNQRRNLRVTTRSGNLRNRHYGRRPAHGVSNVVYRPDRPRSYQVRFYVDGHSRSFGSYNTLEEAAKVAAQARRRLIADEERKTQKLLLEMRKTQ